MVLYYNNVCLSYKKLQLWKCLRRVSSSLALFSDTYLWITTLAWNPQYCLNEMDHNS